MLPPCSNRGESSRAEGHSSRKVDAQYGCKDIYRLTSESGWD